MAARIAGGKNFPMADCSCAITHLAQFPCAATKSQCHPEDRAQNDTGASFSIVTQSRCDEFDTVENLTFVSEFLRGTITATQR